MWPHLRTEIGELTFTLLKMSTVSSLKPAKKDKESVRFSNTTQNAQPAKKQVFLTANHVPFDHIYRSILRNHFEKKDRKTII